MNRARIRTIKAGSVHLKIYTGKWKQNGLRHSYASYRLAVMEDVSKLSLELGNSPQKVFSNYRKVVTKSRENRWFGVLPETPANVVPITAVRLFRRHVGPRVKPSLSCRAVGSLRGRFQPECFHALRADGDFERAASQRQRFERRFEVGEALGIFQRQRGR